jgi:hypothetical protein
MQLAPCSRTLPYNEYEKTYTPIGTEGLENGRHCGPGAYGAGLYSGSICFGGSELQRQTNPTRKRGSL